MGPTYSCPSRRYRHPGLTLWLRYLRALAAFYIRLTFRSLEVYELLEPLMKDFRKLRVRQVGTSFANSLCASLPEERR